MTISHACALLCCSIIWSVFPAWHCCHVPSHIRTSLHDSLRGVVLSVIAFHFMSFDVSQCISFHFISIHFTSWQYVFTCPVRLIPFLLALPHPAFMASCDHANIVICFSCIACCSASLLLRFMSMLELQAAVAIRFGRYSDILDRAGPYLTDQAYVDWVCVLVDAKQHLYT